MQSVVMATKGRHCWKWQNAVSLRSILHRHFFSSIVSATTYAQRSDSLSSLENFLVGSLGFSAQQALSTSTKLTKFRQNNGAKKVSGLNFFNNADSIITFLKQKGLEKAQIRNLVYSVPEILTSKIEKTLEPKITFFEHFGLSVSEFADVVSTQPIILVSSLDSTIRPAFDALRAIMGSNVSVVKVIKGFRLHDLYLVNKNIVRNVSLMRVQGIPLESIQKLMLRNHSLFTLNLEVLKGKMAQADDKWGVSPSSSRFLGAVFVLSCLSEKNVESKCRVFERFGWNRSDVVDMFRRKPSTLAISEETITAKLRFFMNELGYDPGYIAKKPNLMLYSLGKRVKPRHFVLQLLKKKGLITESFRSIMQSV